MFRRILRLHVLRSALATTLTAGFLATPVGLAHVDRAHLDQCDAPVPGPDPGVPRMGSAAGPGGHGHCFTCHWFRSLRCSFVAAGIDVPDAGPATLFVLESPVAIAARCSDSVGARAPPA